jgi:hypothetical protein
MARYTRSRILPIALILIIVIIAVVAIVSLTRAVFFSGPSTSTTSQTDTSRDALLNTSASHSVRMTVRGPIVADEVFHSYQISVTPSSRTLVTYTGYLDKKVGQVALSNNVPSYEEFIYALDRANLTKGKQLTGTQNDTRGVCATGQVFEFEILDDTKSVKQLWTSTCSGSKGSLDASVKQLTALFVAQIPDSSKLIKKVNL